MADRDTAWRLVIAVAVMLALGLCLWHGGSVAGHDHGSAPDLCAGIFLASFITILLRLAVVGALSADTLRPVPAMAPHLLDPPPRGASLS